MSPSTRRAWIEIFLLPATGIRHPVALHPEGVDRNPLSSPRHLVYPTVALHPEGVDRNFMIFSGFFVHKIVALHPEGVDRNLSVVTVSYTRTAVALHPEGVDRNFLDLDNPEYWMESPSTRRAWIEIVYRFRKTVDRESPSTRRAWIEIRPKAL